MKKGFAVSGLFIVLGLAAVFAAVVLVAQGTGFLPRAQSYNSLNLSVEAKNVDGKAKVSASWKQIPGAEYRYGLFKGSEAKGEAVIALKSTTSTSFTSKGLDLTDGKYTFIVIAGRQGGGFDYSGIKFNGKIVTPPHVDRGPMGYFGQPQNPHGTGVNDRVQSGFGVDTKTFSWKAKNTDTPPTVNENLSCSAMQFETNTNAVVVTATPGQQLTMLSLVNNMTGQNLTGIKNVYKLSGNLKHSLSDLDSFCEKTSDDRVVCTFDASDGAGVSSGKVIFKVAGDTKIGSSLTLKNNLTAGEIKGKDCTNVVLTVVAP